MSENLTLVARWGMQLASTGYLLHVPLVKFSVQHHTFAPEI